MLYFDNFHFPKQKQNLGIAHIESISHCHIKDTFLHPSQGFPLQMNRKAVLLLRQLRACDHDKKRRADAVVIIIMLPPPPPLLLLSLCCCMMIGSLLLLMTMLMLATQSTTATRLPPNIITASNSKG